MFRSTGKYVYKLQTTNWFLLPLASSRGSCFVSLPSSDSVRLVSLVPVASVLPGNGHLPEGKFK